MEQPRARPSDNQEQKSIFQVRRSNTHLKISLSSYQRDKAYQGGKNTSRPYKKPRKGELASEQKALNKELSSNAIFVEHVIRLVKIFRVAQQRFPLNSRIY
jgi:hypothetical protein